MISNQEELTPYLNNLRDTFRPNSFDPEIWYNFFGYKDLEENRHEFIKKLFYFNFSINKKKTDFNYSFDSRIVIMIQEKPKCLFTSSIFNEHNFNFKKFSNMEKCVN
jgi:hypothetical protein